MFNFPDCDFLVINSYFPCDPRSDNFDESELLKLLGDISNAIETSCCQKVMLLGDLNADFSRCSTFTELVHDFISDLGLRLFWHDSESSADSGISAVDYTYSKLVNGVVSFSIIDHFE